MFIKILLVCKKFDLIRNVISLSNLQINTQINIQSIIL